MRDNTEGLIDFLCWMLVVVIVAVGMSFFYTKYVYTEERKILSQNEQIITKNSESYIQGRNSELGRLYLELQKHEVGSNTYNAIKEVGCDINLQLNTKNQKWSSICE